jgi:hypothetical protein
MRRQHSRVMTCDTPATSAIKINVSIMAARRGVPKQRSGACMPNYTATAVWQPHCHTQWTEQEFTFNPQKMSDSLRSRTFIGIRRPGCSPAANRPSTIQLGATIV